MPDENVIDLMQRMSAMPLTSAAVQEGMSALQGLNVSYAEAMKAADEAVTEALEELLPEVQSLRKAVVDSIMDYKPIQVTGWQHFVSSALQTINFEIKMRQRIAAKTGVWE